jgi:hypothetical protein
MHGFQESARKECSSTPEMIERRRVLDQQVSVPVAMVLVQAQARYSIQGFFAEF